MVCGNMFKHLAAAVRTEYVMEEFKVRYLMGGCQTIILRFSSFLFHFSSHGIA